MPTADTTLVAPECDLPPPPAPAPARAGRARRPTPPSFSPALKERLLIAASLTALYLIWGSTYLGMKVAIETLPPFLMAAIRFITAGGLLYGALRLAGVPAPDRRQWGASARTGALLLVCGNGFVAVGQQWVSSSFAAVVVATMPLWMALFSTVQSARGVAGALRPSRVEWLGLLIGFAGAALLQAGGELRAAHPAALLILFAPVCWALGSLQSRTLPLPKGPMATAAQMLTGGVAMLGVSFLLGERITVAPSPRSLIAVAYLTLFGSIVAFSAYGYLLRRVRPAIATSYAYVNPMVAIALGAFFGGETIPLSTWIAAVVILVGVAISARARASSAPHPVTPLKA
ncbi:drug/metabolite exporter YedA [Chondromyces crocatus]|uniref:Membrane protein n=1 Tax=Chondromyces crocatus TaxID=52 RepID=A0A0K1E687_CHOCO|nr:drug/metabolite exporter YedA [Chondromyces crocatus]AKT36401.1 membrane protein [Chondromyces crocatus]